MTSEQYWFGDPSMLTEYYSAWLADERQRMSDMDIAAWLFGMYNAEAHSVVLGNAFAKKGSKKPEYTSEPRFLKSFLDEKARKKVEEAEREKALREMQRRFEKMATVVTQTV